MLWTIFGMLLWERPHLPNSPRELRQIAFNVASALLIPSNPMWWCILPFSMIWTFYSSVLDHCHFRGCSPHYSSYTSAQQSITSKLPVIRYVVLKPFSERYPQTCTLTWCFIVHSINQFAEYVQTRFIIVNTLKNALSLKITLLQSPFKFAWAHANRFATCGSLSRCLNNLFLYIFVRYFYTFFAWFLDSFTQNKSEIFWEQTNNHSFDFVGHF